VKLPKFVGCLVERESCGYAELGVQHIMFQVEPYTPEARERLTEALHLYRRVVQR